MLLKQPDQGNVVTQFTPHELTFNATPTQKNDLSEMPGFLSEGLTVLICGEASMLSASIRKMFDLGGMAQKLYKFTVSKLKEVFVNTRNRC